MDQTVAVREEPRPRGGRSAGTMTLARRPSNSHSCMESLDTSTFYVYTMYVCLYA